ncbi:MAG: GAF domain-containing protein, partial [Candidatus Methylomirabilales bacterium]
MPETRPSDLLAALAELCASLEPSSDPSGAFHPCLRALTEGLSLSGAALWGARAEHFILLAQHGLPEAWAEGAARLKADAPVAVEAFKSRGVAILRGASGLPPLPGLASAAAAVPLRAGTRTVGLLVALGERPEIFGEAVRDLLAAAGAIFAGALGFDQRLRQATARAERLQDLTRVAQRLVALLDVESLPQAIAQEAARLLGAEAA